MKTHLSWQDLALFGKIVSTALLFGGYILLGLYIGRELASRGYPPWAGPAGALCGALAGTLHGAAAVRDILKKKLPEGRDHHRKQAGKK